MIASSGGQPPLLNFKGANNRQATNSYLNNSIQTVGQIIPDKSP